MIRYAIVDGKIRVLHLDLDKSWWKRANSPWERDVAAVEGVMRLATGLSRITKRHLSHYVELRVRQELRAAALVAVKMQFGPPSIDISLFNVTDRP